jgi:hypothetical protein
VPPLAVRVIVKVPVGVELEVDMLSVEDPEPPLTDGGLKLPVAPLGSPLTLSETALLKPLSDAIETEKLVLPPAVTVCEPGVPPTEKSGVLPLTSPHSAGTFGGSHPTCEV